MADSHRQGRKQLGRQVIDLLETELLNDGFDLLDVRVFQGGGRTQIRIYIDLVDGGIAMGECAKASRNIGMLLEEADIVPGRYVLEVSSPGIRRPLRKAQHFQAVVGQNVDLKVTRNRMAKKVKGLLQAADEARLVVVPEKEPDAPDEAPATVTVALRDVLEASLDPEFDAQAIINAERRERKDSRRQARAERKPKKSRPKASKKAPGDEPE